MNICILGCGNVGVAMAADISKRNHSVTLVKTSASIHNETFHRLSEQKEIIIKEKDTYCNTAIQAATIDLSVIRQAELIIITVQTLYHEQLIERIKGYLHKDQIVLFVPSYMSSFYMLKHIDSDNMPTLVEMTGTPIEGRIEDDMIPNRCMFRVGSRLKKNFISIYQADRADAAMRQLSTLGYGFENRYSPIEAGLLNPNLVLHTAGSILSIPRIEKAKGDFCMYHEAYSRDNTAMLKIVEALDNEKNAVLNCFGYRSVGYLETADFWGESALEKFWRYAESNDRAKAPTSLHSRYITEDVSQGLVLLESIAHHLSVPTPLATALIDIANAALSCDFRANGRTIERLNATAYIQSHKLQ